MDSRCKNKYKHQDKLPSYQSFQQKEEGGSEINQNHCQHLSDQQLQPLSSSPSSSSPPSFDILHEFNLLFHIALPTVAVQFCTFIIFPITASYVGRNLTADDMAAFNLGSLSGNMTCISIIIGILSASETLQPRAFALGQYDEVGILAIRGAFICCLFLCLPIVVLMCFLRPIFAVLGQEDQISLLVVPWIRVYVLSLPFTLLFRVIQRFLACQNVVLPCLFGCSVSSLLVHPLILHLMMMTMKVSSTNRWTQFFQFDLVHSALAIVITQSLQLVLTLCFMRYSSTNVSDNDVGVDVDVGNEYLQTENKYRASKSMQHSYNRETWKGLSRSTIQKALLDVDGLVAYVRLSLGGIFSLSEWWYWECICLVAGRLGVTSLCVHSVTYQIIPLVYMVPLGMSIGLSVRMGQLLPYNVASAKLIAVYTMALVIGLSLIVTGILYYNETWIVGLFTNDETIIEGCSQIWGEVCKYILGLYVFCLNSGILRALGLQWRMGMTIIFVLWFFSLPCIIYFCILSDDNDKDSSDENSLLGVGGLVKMWSILFWSYIVLNIGLITCYVTADWNEIGRKAALSHKVEDTRKDGGIIFENEEEEDNISYDPDCREKDFFLASTEESSLISFESNSMQTIGKI